MEPGRSATGTPLPGARPAPRVCLSMIVRNEGVVLERCLQAALPIVDAAVICDTGSSDHTTQVAAAFLERHQIPGRIGHHVWDNFGANRTAALAEASDFLASRGWRPEETYWLLLDADHELVLNGFTPSALVGDAFVVEQRSQTMSYWTPRLLRASLGWSAVGRTHERYASPAQPAYERLHGLWIRDHEDGGARADKFTRDIAWLTTQLEETPNDPRTLFYLAQSYLAIGDPLKALLLYRRRIAIDDGHDEVWYSKLCVGRILADGGQWELAAAALGEAQAAQPSRAEPWYELAALHRRHQRWAEAADCARQGRALPEPTATGFIVHTDVRRYRLDLEIARATVAAGDNAGADACERLLVSRSLPDPVREEVRRLAIVCAQPLAGAAFLPLLPDLDDPWRPCNPSIIATAEGYIALCRAVNYEQRRLYYRSRDEDGIFRTRNLLLHLDAAGQLVTQREVAFTEPAPRTTRVRGLEDCRLFTLDETLAFTCTTTDRHPSGLIHQSLCELDASGRVTAHRPLVGAFDDRHQKNWLPFVENGRLQAIYGYDPMRVLTITRRTGEYHVARELEPWTHGTDWRGSAGPLSWPGEDDRRLVLVHEAVQREGPDRGWERVYLHRFLEYDHTFVLTRVSRPFVFTHKGVEFACGMCAHHDGTSLIVGLGVEDQAAYLVRVPLTTVNTVLAVGTAA